MKYQNYFHRNIFSCIFNAHLNDDDDDDEDDEADEDYEDDEDDEYDSLMV